MKVSAEIALVALTCLLSLNTDSKCGVIEPDDADLSLYCVTVDGKDGFINNRGEMIIRPTFAKAYPFHEGLAAVQFQTHGKWGFIDKTGETVIEPKFRMAGFFSDGLARVRQDEFTDPWGYIDATGKMVIAPRFEDASSFVNGIARVGFLSTKSKLLALIDAPVQYEYQFIDRKGNFVDEPPRSHYAKLNPDGLASFVDGEKYGYVDAQNRVVIRPKFQGVHEFSDGLACVHQGSSFGFINTKGEWVIKPQFKYANDFSEGLVGVPIGDRDWGLIDRTGKVVVEPQFSWVMGPFRDGLAEVVSDRKTGYIDRNGQWVWRPTD